MVLAIPFAEEGMGSERAMTCPRMDTESCAVPQDGHSMGNRHSGADGGREAQVAVAHKWPG